MPKFKDEIFWVFIVSYSANHYIQGSQTDFIVEGGGCLSVFACFETIFNAFKRPFL